MTLEAGRATMRSGQLPKLVGMAAFLAGCTGAPGREPAPPVQASGSPVQRTAEAWTFPESPAVAGKGECAGVTLGGVLDAIRGEFDEVAGIRAFRASGPHGVTMNPGMPVAEGAAPAPAAGTSAFVIGLMDARGFGAIFFSGARCRGDLCDDRAYWYFDTEAGCRPRLVGQHRVVQKVGGRLGTCVDVAGEPLWNFPGPTAARDRCDADWSAQDISKTWPAYSLQPPSTCGPSGTVVPVDVTIRQERDLAVAHLVVRGTGIGFLDGRELAGKVERQNLEGFFEETTQEPCAAHRTIRFSLDFETSNNGLPGGFGLIDVGEELTGACPAGAGKCLAYLHLVRRE
jgi:hypothetical protein